jgi:hypothetical protein
MSQTRARSEAEYYRRRRGPDATEEVIRRAIHSAKPAPRDTVASS